MRTAFIAELVRSAEADTSLWLVTGDLGYSVLEVFASRFPDRYLNAGVAEQNMIGVAAGLAREGAHVFVYSIANFPTFRCLEQIRNDVCYPGLPVTIVSVGSGFTYGSHGYTHHAIEDLAVMRALPGIHVVSPGDPSEATDATRALAQLNAPGYLRLGKAGETVVPSSVGDSFVLGRPRTIRDGRDVTIFATGSILAVAERAATRCAADGIGVRVMSAHTLKPFDTASVRRALEETSGVVTVEEHRAIGGLRSAFAESLVELDLVTRVPVRSLAVEADVRAGTGDQTWLRRASIIDEDAIVDAVREVSRLGREVSPPSRDPRG